jgi:magnesium-transporting ATPase (P-type)
LGARRRNVELAILATASETPEIYTDTESKLRKYRRLLAYMGFFLVLLLFLGTRLLDSAPWAFTDQLPWISAVYFCGMLLYAVLIPLYIVVVVQLLRRISELKKKDL